MNRDCPAGAPTMAQAGQAKRVGDTDGHPSDHR